MIESKYIDRLRRDLQNTDVDDGCCTYSYIVGLVEGADSVHDAWRRIVLYGRCLQTVADAHHEQPLIAIYREHPVLQCALALADGDDFVESRVRGCLEDLISDAKDADHFGSRLKAAIEVARSAFDVIDPFCDFDEEIANGTESSPPVDNVAVNHDLRSGIDDRYLIVREDITEWARSPDGRPSELGFALRWDSYRIQKFRKMANLQEAVLAAGVPAVKRGDGRLVVTVEPLEEAYLRRPRLLLAPYSPELEHLVRWSATAKPWGAQFAIPLTLIENLQAGEPVEDNQWMFERLAPGRYLVILTGNGLDDDRCPLDLSCGVVHATMPSPPTTIKAEMRPFGLGHGVNHGESVRASAQDYLS